VQIKAIPYLRVVIENRDIWGLRLLGGMALFLVAIGMVALVAAGSVVMLPHEIAILQMDLDHLFAHHHDHTLASFVVHNRVSFGGALIAVGILYWGLVQGALARREVWAWWTLLLSAGIGSSSFLSFLPHGYLDPLHAAGTLAIVIMLCLGLLWTRGSVQSDSLSVRNFIRCAWALRSPERLLMTIWAGGTLLGGMTILFVGMFPVFVVEDLHYMRTATNELEEISASLIPYIAHDRSGFGGALVAGGLAMLAMIWGTTADHFAEVRRWLASAWLIGAVTAIGIHPLVGYTSFSHLLPFLVKDGAFSAALIIAMLSRKGDK
jgi:hypothetical protein